MMGKKKENFDQVGLQCDQRQGKSGNFDSPFSNQGKSGKMDLFGKNQGIS